MVLGEIRVVKRLRRLRVGEMDILCGPSGFGTNTLPTGKVFIPSNSWKIVVCVPLGSGTALSRTTVTNRVIAITIPNVTNSLSSNWRNFVTTPAQIEKATGLNFFTALPPEVANTFRNVQDGVPVFIGNTWSNRQFRFTLNGWPGTNYVVQAATNLAAPVWINVVTNTAPFNYTETNAAAFGQRFYRAKLWP